ncbi:MAG: peptide-methionine (S)-S-oxide reductase [Flavobacteriaceae bacterium]|jgi:peptide-methionine (S)-S-oxide reductase
MYRLLSIFVLGFALYSCAETSSTIPEVAKNQMTPADLESAQVAYFASGCFWCVEAVYESVEGVHEAVSGYSGGPSENPTYAEICTGRTGHAEAVKVYYDSSVVSYQTLVDVFFNSHDPTTLNRQGPDSGTQYRSAVFYQTEAEKKIVKATIKALLSEGEFNNITTEVSKLDIFYDAEDYHQDYERNNPNQPYIKGVSIPRLNAFKAKMPEVLK